MRHILKQGMVALCGISLLCQQGAAVPVLSGNAVKQIHTSQVVAYHYDAWSRLTNRTFPNGVSTVYRYDEYGAVSNIIHYQTSQYQKVITGFTYVYNQDGTIRKRLRINGLSQQAIEQYGYDDDNNLKDYHCSGALCPRDAQGKVIVYQHYTFDAFNNIKTVASNNTLTTYEYDQQIPTRLIDYHNSNPTYPSSQKLRYDRNGNILQDDQGNVIAYDPLDQTRSVSTKQGTTTYFYNGDGRQVGEGIPNGQTTYFMYGQSNLLNTRVGNQQASFLYGANRLGKQDNEGTQYYLTDQGGSVVNTIQAQQKTQSTRSYAYSPYGTESDLSKQPNNTITTQHFGFDGQLTDSQTNWQFLGQGYRAYNPMLHRFMSQDSMSPFDKGGINGYVFGSNSPIMMSDPTGHMSFWANMGIGLAMGIAAGMLTSEMGGWGALAINALAGAVGSNIDAIDNAVHGKAINWKSVGINAGIGAALGAFGGSWSREAALEDTVSIANKISACFTGETKVALAGNKKQDIQNIKLGTWVAAPQLPIGAKKQFIQTSYDSIPITPQTWKEVDLRYIDIIKGKTYINTIELLRPIKWLKRHHITTPGDKITLSIPEFGIVQERATITAIKATHTDTGHIDWLKRKDAPVISRFMRYVTGVRTYTFEDSKGHISHINATPNHLFYVKNRHGFVPIENVSTNDNLLNSAGKSIHLICPLKKTTHCGIKYNKKPMPVYNLEVYQRHTYFIGSKINVLVHNGCFDDYSSDHLSSANDKDAALFVVNHVNKFVLNSYTRLSLDENGYAVDGNISKLIKGFREKVDSLSEDELEDEFIVNAAVSSKCGNCVMRHFIWSTPATSRLVHLG